MVGFYLIHFKIFNPACFHQVLMSPTLFLYIRSSKKQQKSGSALSLPLPCWVSFSPGKDRHDPPLNEFLAGKTSCLAPSPIAPKTLLGQTSGQSSQDSRRMAEPLQLKESQLLREKGAEREGGMFQKQISYLTTLLYKQSFSWAQTLHS